MSMILYLESVSADLAAPAPQPAGVAPDDTPALKLWQPDDVVDEFDDDDFDDEEFDFELGENGISLEKSWHGLHYLLTGDAWGGTGPEAFLLAGGSEQGADLGYGPARLFTATEVVDIAATLDGIDGDDLWNRFDAARMTGLDIYPGIWDEDEDDLKEEYSDYFEELKQFVAAIADRGEALRITMG